ncbi:MAG: tetratricopeptide repeat protein, partial [Cystobacterineae bacterium]|nr:tetratricopeptide repeat protein [Cystobacterineae bacterium]
MKAQGVLDEAAFLEAFYRAGEGLSQGDFAAAKTHLEQALRLSPNNEKTQNLLGLTYFKLNLWKEAAQVYEALVRNNPEDATLHINLGLVFLKQNDTSHAIHTFKTAIALQQDNTKAHNYLGLALAQAGEYARAQEHFLLAGSSAMALRMGQILEELALPPAPPPPAEQKT